MPGTSQESAQQGGDIAKDDPACGAMFKLGKSDRGGSVHAESSCGLK